MSFNSCHTESNNSPWRKYFIKYRNDSHQYNHHQHTPNSVQYLFFIDFDPMECNTLCFSFFVFNFLKITETRNCKLPHFTVCQCDLIPIMKAVDYKFGNCCNLDLLLSMLLFIFNFFNDFLWFFIIVGVISLDYTNSIKCRCRCRTHYSLEQISNSQSVNFCIFLLRYGQCSYNSLSIQTIKAINQPLKR